MPRKPALDQQALCASMRAAIRGGDADALARAIDAGADLDFADTVSGTALMTAAYEGKVDMARILIQRGADPRKALPNGVTAALLACAGGHAASARLLAEAGADLLARLPDGMGPLSAGCRGEHPECVALLLSLGADPNERSERTGLTPAMLCARHGNALSLRLLLEAGADSSALSKPEPLSEDQAATAKLSASSSWPALHFAAEGGHAECARALIEHGADVEWADGNGITALLVCLFQFHGASGCEDVIQARLTSLAERRELDKVAAGSRPASSTRI